MIEYLVISLGRTRKYQKWDIVPQVQASYLVEANLETKGVVPMSVWERAFCLLNFPCSANVQVCNWVGQVMQPIWVHGIG